MEATVTAINAPLRLTSGPLCRLSRVGNEATCGYRLPVIIALVEQIRKDLSLKQRGFADVGALLYICVVDKKGRSLQ